MPNLWFFPESSHPRSIRRRTALTSRNYQRSPFLPYSVPDRPTDNVIVIAKTSFSTQYGIMAGMTGEELHGRRDELQHQIRVLRDVLDKCAPEAATVPGLRIAIGVLQQAMNELGKVSQAVPER